MRESFEKLSQKIKTKEDLIFFLEEIDLAMNLIEKEPEKVSLKKIKGKINPYLFKILKELVKEDNKRYQKAKEIIFFLQELKKYISSLPKISLEIAFEAEKETIERISQWFEETLGKKFVLDLRVNPKIMGGVIIEYKGKWQDFSLRKKTKQLILSLNYAK